MRKKVLRNLFLWFTTLIAKMFCKMKKKLLLIKKTYDFEKKHTKMRYISQNMFCKTYILEHLIAKSSSTKIYCAMNLFFKVGHILLLYAVYIFIYSIFPGPGYLRSEDGVVWLWYSLVSLYIWLTISSCYGSIPSALGLIGRNSDLSTLCHSCGVPCRQRVLKIFPGPGYLRSEDGVVWPWHSLVNLYIYIYIYIYRISEKHYNSSFGTLSFMYFTISRQASDVITNIPT